MCMPSDHNNAAVISYADIFAAMPVQPLPPTRPPYQRQRRHRQQRPIPSLTAVPESTAREDTATTVTTTPKRTLRCTCHNTPAAMRSSVKRRTTATDDVTLSIRLFISLSIAILASKLIADAMYAARVDGLSVTNPRLYKTKRQLPPIEQGNMVIDSIFQIPINTLSAVGTLIKTARPLVRRTRERIQQYYNGQQQYSNGQQQNAVLQKHQYSNGLLRYALGEQYYIGGEKRYSIGRMNSDTESESDQDDGEEEFNNMLKRMQVRNDQSEGLMSRLYGIY